MLTHAQMQNFSEKTAFLWSIADLLRHDFRPHEYGKIVLPFTVLRRLDCVLAPTKAVVLSQAAKLKGGKLKNPDWLLTKASGQVFYNTSRFDFAALIGAPDDLAENLGAYVQGFSPRAREIIESFGFLEQIERLNKAGLLFAVTKKFAEIDLHPERVSNMEMGYIFEELLRRFSEQSGETAGEHFTPREVIRLMVNLLFVEDREVLTKPGVVRSLYDPTVGTGGMLSVAEEYLRELNPTARLELFGQEINPESYAICNADMMMKGQDPDNIAFGNSLTQDGHAGKRFSYMLSNPPFGVEWKKFEDKLRREAEKLGETGRFGAGLPRINDGSLLFVQHMLSKMKFEDEGSRIAVVLNGGPMFAGDAGSGESSIRRWIIENDWLEAIIALPRELFYNTGIGTYVWVLASRKRRERAGTVQLIDASNLGERMTRSLGSKRTLVPESCIAEITRLFGDGAESPISKVVRNEELGFRQVVVERPLRLRYEVTDGGMEMLLDGKFARAVGEDGARAVERALRRRVGHVFQDAAAVLGLAAPALERVGVKLTAALKAALTAAFSVRDPGAPPVLDAAGKPVPDPELRDTERMPLTVALDEYLEREVRPFAPDAWVDESKTRVGYEIPFTSYFFEFETPRPLEEIKADLAASAARAQALLAELLA